MMSDRTHDAAVPSALPVLSRGKHRRPSQGACFMEYTALLAGEAFSDKPRCVDDDLAAVLRGANDKLSDDDRAALLPLLGRAIGLGLPRPPEPPAPGRSFGSRRGRRQDKAQHQAETVRLRREVCRLLLAAVGSPRPVAPWARHGYEDEVSWLFWDLMDEPTPLGASEDYVQRLLDRLRLLHECYERAMAELGIARTATSDTVPAQVAPSEPRALVAPERT